MKDADYYKSSILSKVNGDEPTGKTLELSTPAEMVDNWTKAIEGDLDRPLTTGISKFDADLKNKLRGTVGAYLGYGGTKKSLLALQGCRQNVLSHKNNCTGVYSNMEMAQFQLLSRILDMSFEEDGVFKSYSYVQESRYEVAYKNRDKVKMSQIADELRGKLRELYGRNLYVNSQSNMTIEDYDRLLKEAKKRNGVVDQLVIDGLSMMSGIGTETERYNTNSKELKDLAKDHNVYIPLICHLSKGAEKHTRDTQRFIRGSEKILDNVDFVIMMSLNIDEGRSSQGNIKYYGDSGYISFFNKRGSGNTIDVIYRFNKKRLLIEETDEDPAMYEVDFSKKSKAF